MYAQVWTPPAVWMNMLGQGFLLKQCISPGNWKMWGHWWSPAAGTQVTSSQYINLSYSVSQLNALYCTHRVGMECSCVCCCSQLPCIKLGHEDATSGSAICSCHSSLRAVTLGIATSCLPRYKCFDNWQLFSPFLYMCGFRGYYTFGMMLK